MRLPPPLTGLLVVLQTSRKPTPVELVTLGRPRGVITDIVPTAILANRRDWDVGVEHRLGRYKDRQNPRVWLGLRFGILDFKRHAVLFQKLRGSKFVSIASGPN